MFFIYNIDCTNRIEGNKRKEIINENKKIKDQKCPLFE